MKLAIVDGLKCEAQPKLHGHCPHCDAEVLAKCGTQKIWHWAHVSTRNCDRWWEPETEWHRDWKNEFPEHCQEVRQTAPDGELHIADVKTENGNVLEFQYSSISSSERVSREQFYSPMVWVVNGGRLPRDLPSFRKALAAASRIPSARLSLLLPAQACAPLKRWVGSCCPVYLDFGDAEFGSLKQFDGPVLWRLEFRNQNSLVVATPFSRRSFIEHYRNNGRLRGYRLRQPSTPPPLPTILHGFERYLRQREARRRRWFDRL
jgi:competence protein CoiA